MAPFGWRCVVKDAELLLRELFAASARTQEAYFIAKRAGELDIAAEIKCAGDALALAVGRLVKDRSKKQRVEAIDKVTIS